MEAIYHAEGRCTPNGATAFHYEYTLKDHLGNARVNFRANGTAVTFLEEMHYYPFGMQMEGMGTQNPANKYLYNGKELNDDLGLNWYDYGARWYDAALGRWWSVNPLVGKYRRWSPYNYTLNNPIRFIDPDGMAPKSNDPIADMLKSITVGNEKLFKHLYNNETTHGASSREAGAAIVKKSDGSYRAERFEASGEGAVKVKKPTLREGETHVADYHTHPKDTRYKANAKEGAPFSGEDLVNIKTNNENFTSIIETSSFRMAAVITDTEAYAEFSSDANFQKHINGINSAMLNALKVEAKAYIEKNGSLEGFDEVGTMINAQVKYLNDNNSGLTLYGCDSHLM